MKEIKERLEAIIKKAQENQIDAWEDDLENSKQVMITEDFEKGFDDEQELVEYNGWFDDLLTLVEELKNSQSFEVSLLKRYDDNGAWTHDAELKFGEHVPPSDSMWKLDAVYLVNPLNRVK
jgi:hypothetical protein